MTVVFYDTNKGKHRTIKNVYSVLDDRDDDYVTVCWETETDIHNRDIPKECITSINAF